MQAGVTADATSTSPVLKSWRHGATMEDAERRAIAATEHTEVDNTSAAPSAPYRTAVGHERRSVASGLTLVS